MWLGRPCVLILLAEVTQGCVGGRGRYFLIIFADNPIHVEKNPVSIVGIHVEMTGLKHILWYQIAKFCLQSTFDISVLVEK